MSISPFSVRPIAPGSEPRRARLVVALVVVGIGAALLAYAISPSVRHAVRHAAHSVGRVLDRDRGEHAKKTAPAATTPAGRTPAASSSPRRSRGETPAPAGSTSPSRAP